MSIFRILPNSLSSFCAKGRFLKSPVVNKRLELSNLNILPPAPC